MSTPELPSDVEAFMDFIGQNIALSGDLVWQERGRLKSDMMLVRHRWAPDRVPLDAFRTKCEAVGMTPEEAAEVVDWVQRTQAGRRLQLRYIKDYRWPQEPV
ncbi:hypothetical protein [Streptomyces anulatus]|uniref:hypothetical protein n=1 Tax=Streptomyces anulatus TaxID=1892 RepID=UPI003F4A12F5